MPFYCTTLSRLVLPFRRLSSHVSPETATHDQRVYVRFLSIRPPGILPTLLGVPLQPYDSIGVLQLSVNIYGAPPHISNAFGFLPQEPLLALHQPRTYLSIPRFHHLANKFTLGVVPLLFLCLSFVHQLNLTAPSFDFSRFLLHFLCCPRLSATFPAKPLCIRSRATYCYHKFRIVSTTFKDESTLAWFNFLALVLRVPSAARNFTKTARLQSRGYYI